MKNQKGNIEVLMFLLTLCLIAVAVFLILFVVNEIVFKSNEKKDVFYRGAAEVINKDFEKSYTETYLMPAGKVMIPMSRTIPEKYFISFKLPFPMPKDLENKIEVEKPFYERKEVGNDLSLTIYSYKGADLINFNRIEYKVIFNTD